MLIFLLISFIILYLCHSILISKPKKMYSYSPSLQYISLSLSLGFHLIYVIPYLSLNPKKMYSYSPSLQYVSLSLSLSLSMVPPLWTGRQLQKKPQPPVAFHSSQIILHSCPFFFFFDMCILSLDENTILLIDFYKQKSPKSGK